MNALKPQHPGKLEMVDDVTGTTDVVDASTVPAAVAFVEGQPVVRVVHSLRGSQHVIKSYGQDGALLSTTVSAPAT